MTTGNRIRRHVFFVSDGTGIIGVVDFAFNHDDGAGMRTYDDAEVILIGVSRSGKTPTCVYLLRTGLRRKAY